jgi:hypothetical protein
VFLSADLEYFIVTYQGARNLKVSIAFNHFVGNLSEIRWSYFESHLSKAGICASVSGGFTVGNKMSPKEISMPIISILLE